MFDTRHPDAEPAAHRNPISLPALLLAFVKMGFLAFGGGMAMVAFMERELIQKRRLIRHDEFLNGVALSSVLGGYAVNAACFIGYRLHGFAGGLLSMVAFVAPAAGLVMVIASFYSAHHAMPSLQHALAGLQPAVIALIVSAAWSMGKKSVRTWPAAILCVAGLAAGMKNVGSIYVLAAGGFAGLALGRERLLGARREPSARQEPAARPQPAWHVAPITSSLMVKAVAGVATVSMAELTLSCLKIGLVWVGGAYTIVPMLYQRLVVELKWITPSVFRDGVAIANVTPGPIAILATFCGYQLQGVAGGALATGALYAPSAALMIFLCHNYSRVDLTGRPRDFLDGLNPCVVGLILSAGASLSTGVMVSVGAWAVAIAAFVLLVRYRWSPAFVLAAAAGVGALFRIA